MRAKWLYYDYLRRYGILIVLGLAIGTALGFAYHQTQPKGAIFIANATIADTPSSEFLLVTRGHARPQEAVDDILNTVKRLESVADMEYEIKDIKINSRYRSVLWKNMAMGSVLGIIAAIGLVYLWDDVKTYQRKRSEGESDA